MDAPAAPTTPPAPLVSRDTLIEIAGYLGAAVALSAAGVALEDSGTGVQIGFELATTLVLVAAGWALGEGSDVLARMKSVFWFLAVFAVTALVGLFFDEVVDLGGKSLVTASALVVTVAALVLWWVLRRSLQLVALFGAALVLIGSVVFPDLQFLFGQPDITGVAIALWLYGWGVVVIAALGVVAPRRTGVVLGSIAAVLAPLLMQTTGNTVLGQVLALLSAVALVALGDRLGERAAAGIGIAGVLVVSSAIVSDHADDLGPAIVALVIGLVLLGGAIVAVRAGSADGPASQPPAPPVPPMPG
jgi:hypothetical protein